MSPKVAIPPELLAKYLNGPSSPPPLGIVPHLDDPPNRNSLGLAIGIICMIVSSVALVLRIYSRVFVVKRVHPEDGELPFSCGEKIQNSNPTLGFGLAAFVSLLACAMPFVSDLHQVAFIGMIWCFFHFHYHVGFFVHQWDVRGHTLIDIGHVRTPVSSKYSLLVTITRVDLDASRTRSSSAYLTAH
jgi:hypothetical protein